MGVFGSMVPVLTLGSLSKRWIVPGWRLGWLVMTDPNAIFKNAKVHEPGSLISAYKITNSLIESVCSRQVVPKA